MFEVSEKAQDVIKQMLESKQETLPIRLAYSEGGWAGPSLGMSLDEAKEEDKVFEKGGVTYVINEQLFELAKPINIDFVATPRGSGFAINSNVSGGGSCGGGCCGWYRYRLNPHKIISCQKRVYLYPFLWKSALNAKLFKRAWYVFLPEAGDYFLDMNRSFPSFVQLSGGERPYPTKVLSQL